MKLVDQLSEVPQTQPASKVLWKKKRDFSHRKVSMIAEHDTYK